MVEVSGFLRGFDVGALSSLDPNLQWLPLALGASMLVVLVYGLILGLSKAFNFNELERHSKSEMLNAGATILMVIFLITMLNSAETFSTYFFFCGTGTCPTFSCGGMNVQVSQLTHAIELLQCRASEKASAFALVQEQVMEAAAVPMNMKNTYMTLMGIPVFQGTWFSYFYQQTETYRFINNLLTTFLIGTNALIVVAEYVKKNMLVFYLPVGLLLRSFVFTRGVGAFLISLALGMYFIFPVVYIMLDPAYVPPSFDPPSVPLSNDIPMCYPTFSGAVYTIYAVAASPVASPETALSLDRLKADLAGSYLSLFMHPFAAFAITMVLIRYMMYALGGESQDLMRALTKVV